MSQDELGLAVKKQFRRLSKDVKYFTCSCNQMNRLLSHWQSQTIKQDFLFGSIHRLTVKGKLIHIFVFGRSIVAFHDGCAYFCDLRIA